MFDPLPLPPWSAACLVLLAAPGSSPAPAAAAPLDPIAVERRIMPLEREGARLLEAGEFAAAVGIVRSMAALDPDHPKPYQLAVLMRRRAGGELSGARSLMAELGPGDGPGRLYGEGLLEFFMDRDGVPGVEKALAVYEAAGHLAGQAACLVALGNFALWKGKPEAAAARYEAAWPLQERLGNRGDLADLLANLAKVEARRGGRDAAVAYQRRVIDIRRELGDAAGEGQAWHALGEGLDAAGDREGALDAFTRARRIRAAVRDAAGEISTLRRAATVHADAEEWGEAIALLEEAARLGAPLADRHYAAQAEAQLGEVLLAAGRLGEARRHLAEAARLEKDLGRRVPEAEALVRLGIAVSRQGEPRAARRILEEALRLAVEQKNRRLEAAARTELASALAAAGELAAALAEEERALALQRGLKNRRGEMICLNNLAALHLTMNDISPARATLAEVLDLATALEDAQVLASARANLGVAHAEAGDLGAALTALDAAVEQWRSIGQLQGLAATQAAAAETLHLMGREEEAAQRRAEALEVFRRLDDRAGEVTVLNGEGEAHLGAGRPAAAAASFRTAIAMGARYGIGNEEWVARAGLGRALEALGEREPALAETRRSITLIEQARARLEVPDHRMRFMAGRADPFEHAIDLLLTAPGGPLPGDQDEAFRLAEGARARGLLELLYEERLGLRLRLPEAIARREAELLDRIGVAQVALRGETEEEARGLRQREIEAALADLDALRAEARRTAPLQAGVAYPDPPSLATLRERILLPGEVMLHYATGRRRGWLFVTDRRGTALHEIPPAVELARLVEDLRRALEEADRDLTGEGWRKAAERLSRAVLPRRALPRAERLLIVPDGPLHHVPFEVLDDGHGRMLVERHDIAIVPSATILDLLRASPPPPSERFLGVAGDAIPQGGPLAPLPHARREVEAIGDLFAPEERLLLMGAEAAKARLASLELSAYRFIHFAAHGWLDADVPRLSGVRLGPGAGEVLARDEILGLDLAAEVVVLSACASGDGEIVRGEGLVGLTRAFLYAGARSVVVSLWSVGDRSTAALMTDFYRRLRQGVGAAAALRGAKLAALASRGAGSPRLPPSWAPFVLVGAPGPAAAAVNLEARAATKEK